MTRTNTTTITLIRHGESQSQADPEVDGINPDLSPRGEQQAIALRDRVDALAPDRVIVSPLIRAFRTYRLSEIQCPDVTFDPRLVESDWGKVERYEGVTFGYLDDSGRLEHADWHHRPVKERVRSLIDAIEASDLENVVLFGHWGVFSEFLGCFIGVDGARIALMENTALSRLEIREDGMRRLIQWNDSTHLGTR
jgi:broad specificity phosphatase PhoE